MLSTISTILDFIFLLCGAYLMIMGLLGWKKQNIKIFCGTREIKVDVGQYVKYSGITAVSVGMFFIITGILKWFIEIPVQVIFIGVVIYYILIIYIEKKYKIKD